MINIIDFCRYSHGYLFPSEVTRVKRNMLTYLEKSAKEASSEGSVPTLANAGNVGGLTPSAWAHSSVSTFGVRYTPPLPDLSPAHGAEALVEGSDMSTLREGTSSVLKKPKNT
jgi:hypothetical protein